ncbi:MAG: hypothetical protein KBB55_03190 [Candidatus Buchananbacteria bacterium]|nr:hypothetical protein [Candidatus Buchananbacteria bacterium]
MLSEQDKKVGLVTLGIVGLLLGLIGAGAIGYAIGSERSQIVAQTNKPVVINDASELPKEVAPKPADNPPEGWSKYTNTQYGYEFFYPATWKVIKEKDMVPEWITWISENPEASGASSGVSIFATSTQSVAAALKAAQDAYANPGKNRYSVPEVVTINGITAVKQAFFPYEIVPPGVNYVFPERGLELSISYDATTTERIISSFKFTK